MPKPGRSSAPQGKGLAAPKAKSKKASVEDELEQRFGLHSGGFEGLGGGALDGAAEAEDLALRGMLEGGEGEEEEGALDSAMLDGEEPPPVPVAKGKKAKAALQGKAEAAPKAAAAAAAAAAAQPKAAQPKAAQPKAAQPKAAQPAKAAPQPKAEAPPKAAPPPKAAAALPKSSALVAQPAPAGIKAKLVVLPKASAAAAAAAVAAPPPAAKALRGLLDDDDEEEGEEEGDEEEEEEEEDGDEDDGEEEEEDDEDEDDDDESVGSLGGADVYRGGDLEAAARKASAKRARVEAEADADMRLGIAEQEIFQLPSGRELEEERSAPPRLGNLKRRFTDISHVLTNFRARREPGRAREEYIACLAQDLADFYGYNRALVDILLPLFSPAEALQFFEANEAPPPVTIRVNTLKAKRRDLVQALMARGVNLEPVGPWSKAGFKVFESPVPIGATPEYLAGHYMLQSAASLVPAMALAPQGGERVLDVAAAPGGKTTHLAQMMGNSGVLMANDLKKERLPSLIANLARMGVSNAVVCCMDGRLLPQKLGRASMDRVLLDAPCSGLGVIARDPAARTSKGIEDVLKMAQLQKQLILAALDTLDANSKTGGVMVYSTCSVAVEENEAVVAYAMRKRHIKVEVFKLDDGSTDVGRPGLTAWSGGSFHPDMRNTRRFFPHVHNMDGFFVARIRKLSNDIPQRRVEEEEEEAGDEEEEGEEGEDDEEEDDEEEEEEEDDEEDVEEEEEVRPAAKSKPSASSKPALAAASASAAAAAAAAPPPAPGRKGISPGGDAARQQADAAKRAAQSAKDKAAAAARKAAGGGSGAPPVGSMGGLKAGPAPRATKQDMERAAAHVPAVGGAEAGGSGLGAKGGVKRPRAVEAAAAVAAPVEMEREAEAGVVSFIKPGEKVFKKKRKAGKRVQEAKLGGGGGGSGKPGGGGGGGGKSRLAAGDGEVHTVAPGVSARGGFGGKKGKARSGSSSKGGEEGGEE